MAAVKKVVVAGAGIGGLTLAAALRREGVDVHVYERADEFKLAGAGISLMPNAVLALRRIGLDEPMIRAGEVARTAVGRARDGAVFSRFPVAEVAREVGAPLVMMHRADLHAVLLDAVGREQVTLGRNAAGYREDPRGAALTFTDGTEVEADLVVGADGLRSAIRRQLTGDTSEPVYSGYTSWRGVTDTRCGAEPGAMSESWGRGERFGIAPLSNERVYWFAVANAPPGEKDAGDPRPVLLARFGSWHAPVRALIEATPPDHILRTDIADRPVITRWCGDRVALLGDAAHPMTPNLGQGGCQAIEDAVVLARALASEGDLRSALTRYQSRRVERANRIVVDARRFGALARIEHPLVTALRDVALRATPDSVLRKRFLELYRFDG